MEIVLIGDRQIKLEILRITVFLNTAVPRGIAVFIFATKYNIYLYISNLFPYKCKYVGCQYNALRYIQVRYFFAHNCEICFIRGPPVLFEHKKSNRTGGNIIEKTMDRRSSH